MIEPPPQIPTFNYIWQKWFGNLYNALFTANIVVVEDSDMSNSWVAIDATRQPRYWKDGLGVVHLSGLVKNGTSITTTIFTLPEGYRPDFTDSSGSTAIFAVSSDSGYGEIRIYYTGNVNGRVGSTNWISLDGITFKAT